ncbi:MAG: dienelactone hydrolase family protein [Chloroflexota bacterium]
MCFDHDSRPPIEPIAGGSIAHEHLELTATDGNRFMAFRADAANPSGAGMLVLPDVRGLHRYYEELTLRFAEAGIDAIAIDYFGRTAGIGDRGEGFEYMPHVSATTWAGLQADVAAAAAHLRATRGVTRLFDVGFCFGGRVAADLGLLPDLDLAGAIPFYGWPVGPGRNDLPVPADTADQLRCPVLAIFGGADQGIPPEAVETYRAALAAAGPQHRVISYEGAPHSFFDRKQEEFADQSAAAWSAVLGFVRA